MELFTKVPAPKSEIQISYKSRIAFVGSCFAQNVSRKFSDLKFDVLVNPFGTQYNPMSIAAMFQNVVDRKTYSKENFFLDNGQWHCWDAHSSLSFESADQSVSVMNESVLKTRDFLQKADVVFVTLGTALVYFLKNSGEVVSNCHRQNPEMFDRRLISVSEAADAISGIVKNLRQLNQKVKAVFTVSPLRHWSDGAHENNVSKSTLHLAIHEVMKAKPDCVEYFPSYEIVMDELRDYRFYESDMIHLSDVAENVIFERMKETYFDEKTAEEILLVEKFMKSANHRVTSPESPKLKDFAVKMASRAEDLMSQISGLDLSEEKAYFLRLQEG